MIPLIVIEGPTASGKSRIAFELAKSLNTEIISADSRQIYRYMDIGTAKPPAEELSEVKHHLVSIVEPSEEYSAGKFSTEAGEIIVSLWKEEKIPIVCGGTGFYVKALLEGLFASPQVDEQVRRELEDLAETKGDAYLFEMLTKIDPLSAKRVHPNDSYRVKRALEIWIATGKSISEHWEEQSREPNPYQIFRVLIDAPREELYRVINHRLELMVKNGLIEEIRELFEKGYNPNDPGMKSVGYRDFYPYILENGSFITCMENAKQATRNYAKRQFTWYRRIEFNYVTSKLEHSPTDLAVRIITHFRKKGLELS